MKKIVISLAILFSCFFVDKGFALQRDEEWKGWRSTETRTAETDVLVATGSVYIFKIFTTPSSSCF